MYSICMKHILITIAAVVLVGCVSTTREDLTRTKALLKELNDVNSSYVFIAAHRGGHERDWENRAPENSIANIKKAVSMDFEIYESDVRVSKDGHLVIMHDTTVDRTTTGKGLVSDLKLSELKQLKLKYKNKRLSKETVPTLEELLVKGKGKILFKIDFKASINFFPDAANLVKKHNMLGQVFFRFDWSQELAGDLASLISNGMPAHPNLILFRTKTSKEVQAALTQFKPKLIELYSRDKEITSDTIEAVRLAKGERVIIGINSWGGETEWQELINLGFRIFHTKKPEAFAKFLKNK